MYNPKIWYDGDIVTSGGLNNIEQGIAQNAHDIEDLQGALGGDLESYVNDWLESHPEATTTVQDGSITEVKLSDTLKLKTIKDYVTPEMFGAVGDGAADDFAAFVSCAEYANANNLPICVSDKTYFINGNRTITLKTDVYCFSSTFLLGANYTSRPVFAYMHDDAPEEQTGALSNFIANNHEVKESLKDKFFILDTLIKYGTASAPEAPDDETIKEVIVADDVFTDIYWCNNVADYQNRIVTITNISSTKEKGYSFSGCTIETNVPTGKIKRFLLIERNNITLDNITINVGSTTGGAAVIQCNNSNNITINNIKTLSEQNGSTWGYDFAFGYCANIYVNNVKGINAWSSISSRGLKNYTLTNSRVTTFDCHWNGFGIFNCINNIMEDGPHLGYGNGVLNVINCSCKKVAIRYDYLQSWYGDINIENTVTVDGVHLQYPDIIEHDYDDFFNEFKLPKISIKNCVTPDRILYLRMPDGEASRVVRNYLTIENTKFSRISVPNKHVCYYATLLNVPYSSQIISQLQDCAIILFSNYKEIGTSFNIIGATADGTGVLETNGQMVVLSLTGNVTHDYTAWEIIGTLPEGYRPTTDKYFVATIGRTNIVTLLLSKTGPVSIITPISANNDMLAGTVSYIAAH